MFAVVWSVGLLLLVPALVRHVRFHPLSFRRWILPTFSVAIVTHYSAPVTHYSIPVRSLQYRHRVTT